MPVLCRVDPPKSALALAERLLEDCRGDVGNVLIRGLVTATTSAWGDVPARCLGELTDADPMTTTGTGGEPIWIDWPLPSEEA